MIKIKYEVIDDIVYPASPIPEDAILVISDGKCYTVYFEGDKLPES